MTSKFQKLKQEIIKNSDSKIFIEACNEWKITHNYWKDKKDICSCSQLINDIYIIENVNNFITLKIGSTCIRQFQNKNLNNQLDKIKKQKQKIKEKLKNPLLFCLRCDIKRRKDDIYFQKGLLYCRTCTDFNRYNEIEIEMV